MSIPIENIYYLLCYAWDRLDARGLVDAGALPDGPVENLLAKVLDAGVSHLIRQGLDRGYVESEEDGRRLRGKVLLSETLARGSLPAGRVVCRVDELSHDVPHNRVIKAAMRELLALPTVDRSLRMALRSHCQRMHDVSDVALTLDAFRRVQLHRNIARYSFLVNVAHLVARCAMPDERTGGRGFHPFTENEQEMGRLFESFVRNFLRREQDVFHVTATKVAWDLDVSDSSDPKWLPEMRTDVMLTSPKARVVMETKFYAMPFQSRYSSPKLISSHIYQLLTYVSQLGATAGPEPIGVLLYAGSGHAEPLRYRLGGHTMLVRGLDLKRKWTEIHRELLEMVAGLAG